MMRTNICHLGGGSLASRDAQSEGRRRDEDGSCRRDAGSGVGSKQTAR